MISFYPGPSRVHSEIPRYVKEAYRKGILSINHRSEEFMSISERTIGLLRNKLGIPHEYTVFYTSSATECWEIIAQSVMTTSGFHIFNGAFGQKWFEYSRRIVGGAKSFAFAHNELVNVKKLRPAPGAVICLTQNETSNGSQVKNDIIESIRGRYPDHLIAVDATSSMGGILLNFAAGDIWFASVQKCFGLPAGLGLMVCSPAAMKKVKDAGENKHYNSLIFMAQMMDKWQTPFTPNVLAIYLLMRVMEDTKHIREVSRKVEERYLGWIDFFKDKKTLRHLITNEDARSFTVIALEAREALVTAIKSRAKKNGILLGEGYGKLNSSTFRIANFPAIKKSEIKALREFLSDYE